jgi:hypothetical protein
VTKELTALRQRAETIKRKADELFSLSMRVFDDDAYATIMTDNLTCAADDVVEHLKRLARAQKGSA